jgi:hypothetical protein
MSIQHSINELNLGKEQFELFKNPPNFLTAFQHWNSFVDYIGKALNKLENIKKSGSNKFINEVNFANNFGRKDPLLRYLTQLRNVSQHSVQELTGIEFTSNIPTSSIILSRMEIDEFGNQVVVESNEHNLYPSTYKLKTVVNYSIAYVPPSMHQGKPLKFKNDPYEVGQLAIDYYDNLFSKLSLLY